MVSNLSCFCGYSILEVFVHISGKLCHLLQLNSDLQTFLLSVYPTSEDDFELYFLFYFTELQLWDASTGQEFSQYTEHEKRAWSVDFSPLDPMKLVSGSDDCSVKLWSISEVNSKLTYTLLPLNSHKVGAYLMIMYLIIWLTVTDCSVCKY